MFAISRYHPSALALGLLIAISAALTLLSSAEPKIPALFAKDVPASCLQVVLVIAKTETDSSGTLWLLERNDGSWKTTTGPIPVSMGRSGLAWGVGEHRAEKPSNFRVKKEGDGCCPAGVFRIPFLFGNDAEHPDLRLPYKTLTPTMAGVDDVHSKYYNQLVDSSVVTRDWNSMEVMRRDDGLYALGAFIAHNSKNEPGGGSCIFLHTWQGPGIPTSGCTAMEREALTGILKRLDPSKEPRLVQGLEAW